MSDQVAIVTGAGRGIGRAVALALAQQGYRLMLAARTADQLNSVVHSVRRHRVQALAAPTDITVPAEVQAMVDATIDAFGRIDLLVNVAGTAIYKEDITAFTDDEFESTFDVNVKGVFLTTRAVWPVMCQQPDGGVVVNISSLAVRDAFPGFAVYAASKSAVNHMTESLARAGRPHDIRLFAVCPGMVETSLLRSAFPDAPADACLTPAEVADVVLWCVTDAARNCTGQAIYLKKK